MNFTLVDLTKKENIVELFAHLNSYYVNFLKSQIYKTDLTSFKSSEKFGRLVKESPLVVVCDDGKESLQLVTELEKEKFINVFYVMGGAKNP